MLGRFRVQLFPLLAVFAGLSVDWAWRAMRAGRGPALALAVVPFSVLLWWCAPSEPDPFDRTNRDGALMLQLVKAGNFQHALKFRDRMVANVAALPPEQKSPDLARRLNAIAVAFDCFDEALRWPEVSPQRHLHVGRGYMKLLEPGVTKRFERVEFTTLAQREFEQALAMDPEVIGAWHGLGQMHAQNEHVGPAFSAYTQELVLHPENAEAHRDAGFVRWYWKHPSEALQHFRIAEALGLNDARMFACMSRIEVNSMLANASPIRVDGKLEPLFDPARGLSHARRALLLDSEDPLVLEECAYPLYYHGFYDEGVALLRLLITKLPFREVELQKVIGGFLQVKEEKLAAATALPPAPAEGAATVPPEVGALPEPAPESAPPPAPGTATDPVTPEPATPDPVAPGQERP
jgi:tetratricopeptide (TPR) repeat protein